MIGRGYASGQESRKGRVSEKGYKKYGVGLTGAAFFQDIAGPTGQEVGFNTRNTASGAAIARRVSKNRHCKGMLKDCGKKAFYSGGRQRPQKEEGSTRVATVAENYQKREQAGLGRVGTARRGRVDIARPTTQGILQGRRRKGYRRADDILLDRQRKGVGRNEDCLTDKEAAGEDIKGVIKGMLGGVLLERAERGSLEDERRTDIGGISRAVVGRAVNLLIKLGVGRRARRRHTEVRSSYHFRVRTKVNSTSASFLPIVSLSID
ncbi:hypothetical protein BY996DRAFT_6564663 [Phakopsora pachyrhizi]|nr:hypothetical protein BY996DRAFT_6564663 [Phakopsora pachyrhizi]